LIAVKLFNSVSKGKVGMREIPNFFEDFFKEGPGGGAIFIPGGRRTGSLGGVSGYMYEEFRRLGKGDYI